MVHIKKYIVRLTSDFTKEIQETLMKHGIKVVFSDGILKNLLIVETEKTLVELRKIQDFESVEEERIGSVDI